MDKKASSNKKSRNKSKEAYVKESKNFKVEASEDVTPLDKNGKSKKSKKNKDKK